MGSDKLAILLLNMGGPDSLDAVRPFLKNLFSDPAIIGLPGFLRIPLASILSTRRARKVTPRYRLIGGKSPLAQITWNQAEALGEALIEGGQQVSSILPAFSYWHPFISESVLRSEEEGSRNLVVLSLYPQYCRATTGACLTELSRALTTTSFETGATIIDRWPVHPGYLDSLAGTVVEALEKVPSVERDDAVILFSAHGVPKALIESGDPYYEQTLLTVNGVIERLGQRQHQLAFQSRLGPVKWLTPSLPDALRELADRGAPPVVVVPVSFVSDHIETLYELDIQHMEMAQSLGFRTYVRAPALNTRPDFIQALADLVIEAVRDNQGG
jgi:ferrochelatase